MKSLLDHYNEELRCLRVEGAQFGQEHPQVAARLGLHPNGISDPFVERLLEGVAFLSARVHRRMDDEYVEFAKQALSRLAPGFLCAAPSITNLAFRPDLASPEAHRGKVIPRGTLVNATIEGRKQPIRFSTGRDVRMLPLRLADAQCRRSVGTLPSLAAARVAKANALIILRFQFEGATDLGQFFTVQRGEVAPTPYPLSMMMAGDDSLAFELHRHMLCGVTQVLAIAQVNSHSHVVPLPANAVRLAGVDDEEALLPLDLGGFAGLHLLREYFACPARFLGFDIHGLSDLAAQCPRARSFEIVFALDTLPATLIDRVTPEHFRLFATPAINLYPKRCDPLPYDSDAIASWIPVSRQRPQDYYLYDLTDVRAIDTRGQTIVLAPVMGLCPAPGDGSRAPGSYTLHRGSYGGDGPRPQDDPLHSRDLLSISLEDEAPSSEEIRSIQLQGLVADRGWDPPAMLDARWRMDDSMGTAAIDCLTRPGRARPEPSEKRCWEAVSFLGENPLTVSTSARDSSLGSLLGWLALAAEPEHDLDRQRLASLRSSRTESVFMPCVGGPYSGWARGIRLHLDVTSTNHSDGGGWLFGRLLAHALSRSVGLNDGFEVVLSLDGQHVSTHSNLANAEGAFQ
ncbi:type VI secretion system baseplate subunit TssF [Paraburkholderia susongensis]|uniref:Type VI secretion system protein ImpG n=1 Tax=Paraburkholderia susongensis TaxID=1515439 RepID=A0A1X7M6J2_9BURK|nr:type VI secretion system baseplate subunit TssF [Paraburkholderia susongensis]SMG61133.1 type VI secretion system protein ImpG [Paraburkholderia susongensis]